MMRRGWPWALLPIGLLAAGVAFDVVFLVVAFRDPTFAVERDYYRKALEWDRAMAQEVTNAEMGWRAEVALSAEAAPSGSSRLTVAMADRAGQPLDGAAVTAELFHNARSARVLEATLAGEGAGRYASIVPAGRPGLWEVRITVARGARVFTSRAQVELRPAP